MTRALLTAEELADELRSPSAPVFPNNRGGHLNPRNWYNRWFLPVVKTLAEGGLTDVDGHRASGSRGRPQVNPPSASVYAGVTFHSLGMEGG